MLTLNIWKECIDEDGDLLPLSTDLLNKLTNLMRWTIEQEICENMFIHTEFNREYRTLGRAFRFGGDSAYPIIVKEQADFHGGWHIHFYVAGYYAGTLLWRNGWFWEVVE